MLPHAASRIWNLLLVMQCLPNHCSPVYRDALIKSTSGYDDVGRVGPEEKLVDGDENICVCLYYKDHSVASTRCGSALDRQL
jgi:hypothetical protein